MAPTVCGAMSLVWLSWVCTNVPYSRQQCLLKSTVAPVMIVQGLIIPHTDADDGKMFSQNVARYTISMIIFP
eukprot:9287090-Ditylum_brightwellii.AAC.1